MFDAVIDFKKLAMEKSNIIDRLNLYNGKYILTTIHRAENTNDIHRLENIVSALNDSGKEIVLPLHPRTRKYIDDYGLTFSDKTKIN